MLFELLQTGLREVPVARSTPFIKLEHTGLSDPLKTIRQRPAEACSHGKHDQGIRPHISRSRANPYRGLLGPIHDKIQYTSRLYCVDYLRRY